jgi:hypothetical protein
VLKKGLLGGALLFFGGSLVLALRPSRAKKVDASRFKVFDEREALVMSAIAATFIPPREGWPSVEEAEVVKTADEGLSRADESIRDEIKKLLALWENGLAQALFSGHLRPFSELGPSEREEVALGWKNSRLALRRTGFLALRTLVMASYYASEKTWPVIGYPGPPAGFYNPEATP